LLDHNKLACLDLDANEAKEIVLDLAKAGEYGGYCLMRLLECNKLDNLPVLETVEAKELVLELAKIEKGGVDCLRQLIQYDKLQNSKLKGINNPADVKAKSLKLLGEKPPNVKGLISLLDPQIQDS
ncbi:MAG: hypothetical protein LBF49_02320, partial [Puniceicoccales bacterium]|jgi:hypothetical protein|nr:hypothetical protein [Puniceicoccales bacterium]